MSIQRFCQTCKKEFFVRPSVIKKGQGKFCSHPCTRSPKIHTFENAFWPYVQKNPDGCWIWTGRTTQRYGQLSYGKKEWLAHRLSYIIHNGPFPLSLWVLHHCDNPPCVRPDHLFLGNQLLNMQDMIQKGRAVHGKGENNAKHKLTESEVLTIRSLNKNGISQHALARQFNVSRSTICSAIARRSWTYLL